ncbi:hypothetical protein N0V85_001600 [Neurospora sp. IMI 360204]|nr:hypothetical protein N0V85_001600 [Neurospora sp. IMI 360204]
MPTENDKPPEVSCAAALRMGLPAPKTSDQNNCPNGTSTGSSDKSLAASRSTQPVLFLRSVAANCGCVYIAETGIGGHPSHDDLRESGFPVRGRCPQCKVLVTEIRLNEDGQAEVTEINQPPEEEHDEQDGYSEDVEDIYVDEEDVDDYESGEAPQS